MTPKYHQVLAAATPDEVTDFVKVLYVAVIALSSDQLDKKLLTDMSAWLPRARKVAKELGSSIVEDIVSYSKSGEFDEDKLAMMSKVMRSALKAGEIQKDPHVPQNLIDMLLASSVYMINRSPSKLNQLIRLASDLDQQSISQAFVVEASDQKSYIKPLQKIVKAATGEVGSILTAEQVKALSAKYPKLHKEYLRLRKEFNLSWKVAMRNFVYESGKKVLPYHTVVNFLNGQGLQHTLPQGFVGLIDGVGKVYTSTGKAIKTLPGPGFAVEMNENYDPKKDDQYVFTTVTPEGRRSQHVYTVGYSKAKTDEKFAKVANLSKVMDNVRRKWLPYIKKSDTSPQCVASTMLELMYEFSSRIGSMGNATGGTATQGLSTLMVKNMVNRGAQVVLKYKGKDAVVQVHQLDGSTTVSKLLVKNLRTLVAGKEPTDFIFTYDHNGRSARMTGNLVNKWFAKMGAPEGVTVHKLRHVQGSRIFEKLLLENADKIFKTDKPLSQAQADKVLKTLATQVGVQLGHVRGIGKQQKATPSTAIANYIDPNLMVGLYVRLGLRPPRMLAKFL